MKIETRNQTGTKQKLKISTKGELTHISQRGKREKIRTSQMLCLLGEARPNLEK
jgi:hypothetical protein